jgi:hypothetical protein
MYDTFEDSWAYQELTQMAEEKGSEEGKKEACIQFVEIRFPTLLVQAKRAMGQKRSVQQLREVLDKLYRSDTVEDVQAVLLGDEP